MKLSNKGRYAVRALFDIAFYNDGRPTQAGHRRAGVIADPLTHQVHTTESVAWYALW